MRGTGSETGGGRARRDPEAGARMKPQVICVPGSVAPAAQRYRPLIEAVPDPPDLHLKDLEVYRAPIPPADYSIDEECEATNRLAGSKSLDRFHLLGYSGG